ncbi:hypothetical protein [Parasitella parasitica]|uniref:Galactose oxidase n=1 Tax=Parasitella parasitica TaxID=35722 RepID=A0A0B7N0Q0_9FUNG|nr:hypothetical protein [Parasitella parasitica]
MKYFTTALAAVTATIVSNLNILEAIQLQKRSESQCGLLVDSIYCYGGLLVGSAIDSDLYSLPLTNLPNNKSMINFAKTWVQIKYANTDYVLEDRRRANSAVYNNNTLFITGGYTYNGTMITNQTITYNRDTNTWQTLSTYSDAKSSSVRQIYNAAAVNLAPIENSIVLYGGVTENPISNTTVPIQTDSSNQTVMHEGYSSLVSYNVDNNQWLPKSPQLNIPTVFYSAQTATLNPKTGLIYYLGGFYYSSPDYTKENKQDFKSANVFNTSSSSWFSMILSGTTPGARMFPTATLCNMYYVFMIECSAHLALQQGKPQLSLISATLLIWTPTAGPVKPLILFINNQYMTAVLVNTTLFILFGLAVYNNPLDDILVMSVNDVNNLYFPDTYPYVEQIKSPTETPPIEGSSTLSSGAIAGIAVACVVVGLSAIAAVIFFYIRRKREQEKKLDELPVDWDHVDNFYNDGGETNAQHVMVENEKHGSIENQAGRHSMLLTPPSISIEKYAPNEFDDDNFTKDSTTLAGEGAPKFIDESMRLMKPSIVEGNDTRHIESATPPIVKQKPDFTDN